MDHATRAAFAAQERRAFELGQRMADAAFSMTDNPFDEVQPRLARRWLDGFVTKTALAAVASSLRPGYAGPQAARRAA